ncbi:MAG: DUF58 domain-containing protein [Candidatus Woesearchaeota archaeon]
MNVLKRVKKVELRTKHLVEGLLQGSYHSVFKGRGIEFSDVREYSFGDDVRSIDWNVTARMDEPYIKEFIEERDLTVYIIFDVSGSSFFGSDRSKYDANIDLAASLMFAAMRNNDNCGLLLFSEDIEKFVPARKGRKHILRLIREMIEHEPKNKGTNIKKGLMYLSRILKKRAIVFVISDFFDSGYGRYMRQLAHRHDVIAIHMRDKNELEMPDVGYAEIEDYETGERVMIDTSDPKFRSEYKAHVRRHYYLVKKTMRKSKVDLITMTTEGFEVPLRKFFRRR